MAEAVRQFMLQPINAMYLPKRGWGAIGLCPALRTMRRRYTQPFIPASLAERIENAVSEFVSRVTDVLIAGYRHTFSVDGKHCLVYSLEKWYERVWSRRKKYWACGGVALLSSYATLLYYNPFGAFRFAMKLTDVYFDTLLYTVANVVDNPKTTLALSMVAAITICTALYRCCLQYKVLNEKEKDIRCGFRHAFSKPIFKEVRDSSHPAAAHERGELRAQLLAYAEKTGLPVFVFDPSPADVARARRGQTFSGFKRAHFIDKDVRMTPSDDTPPDGAIVVMIDSDYYRDMPWICANWICVFYTFAPEHAGGRTKNGVYSFNEDNVVTMHVQGGAVYDHSIWNWFIDHFSVPLKFGRVIVKSEARRVSPDRFVVLTVPDAYVSKFHISWDSDKIVQTQASPPLSRVQYTDCAIAYTPYLGLAYPEPSGVVAIRRLDEDGVDWISFSLTGLAESLDLPYSVYVSTHIAYKSQTTKSTATIEKLVRHSWGDNAQMFNVRITLLKEVLDRLRQRVVKPQLLGTPYSSCDLFAQPGFMDHRPDDPPELSEQVDNSTTASSVATGRAVGPQVLPGPVIQSKNEHSISQAIKERILDVRAAPTKAATMDKYTKLVPRFMEAVFPGLKHSLHPLSVDEVKEALKKPSQRLKAEHTLPSLTVAGQTFKVVQAFIKAEPAANPSKPLRIISPVSDDHCFNWSQFTLPFSTAVKERDWYAFGKSPAAVAARVHLVAGRSKRIVGTDYTKFDGTRSDCVHAVERGMTTWIFDGQYKEAITKLFDDETQKRAFVENVFYRILFARLSGTPGTALYNSLTNCFVAWCVIVRCNPGISDAAAVEKLGVYGGDDGFTPDVEAKVYKAVASELGLQIKVEHDKPPTEPVTFLARTYINPSVHPGSISDIKRVLGKVHLTCCPKDTPTDLVLARKGHALLITDPDTPILGDLGNLLLRGNPYALKVAVDMIETGTNPELGWMASEVVREKLEVNERYPVYPDLDQVLTHVSDALGVLPDAVYALVEAIDKCDHFRDLETVDFPAEDWIAKTDTRVGGNLYFKGEGVKDGVPVSTPTMPAASDLKPLLTEEKLLNKKMKQQRKNNVVIPKTVVAKSSDTKNVRTTYVKKTVPTPPKASENRSSTEVEASDPCDPPPTSAVRARNKQLKGRNVGGTASVVSSAATPCVAGSSLASWRPKQKDKPGFDAPLLRSLPP